jgi:hypothetical protein
VAAGAIQVITVMHINVSVQTKPPVIGSAALFCFGLVASRSNSLTLKLMPGRMPRIRGPMKKKRISRSYFFALDWQTVWGAWVCSNSLINLISMLRYCSQSETTSWLVPLT